MSLSTEECCPICLKDQKLVEIRRTTGCKHPICSECLQELFKASAPGEEKGVTRTLCPICRTDLMDSIEQKCSWCQNKVSNRLPDRFCAECGQIIHLECASYSRHKHCSGKRMLKLN